MSSGFVSGGTTDVPIERSDEWLEAQKEIEANRRRKAEQAAQSDGKSLFETLEANKAAKQDAFEEANRLKNQFRALDEDEVEFLDSVLESTRAEEDRVKRETAEGLAVFRRQQEEADKKARRGSDADAEAASPTVEEESWVAGGRKRKRAKEKEVLKGVKVRRSSTVNEDKPTQNSTPAPANATSTKAAKQPEPAQSSSTSKQISSPLAAKEVDTARIKEPVQGLVDYGSDEDDDW
ncbi:hypothetical protein G7Y89_g4303 [Cudoniella acicularis]|uniref:FAM192A/Fyv6 N-terminal domain-containing protein n=1 Tax=Cudoniella acicularis TaxID=354080 RepID=A0A8H4W4F1_9HELO|nr:hypothetical protein G7Y89_g4303 [Cudoniella acicularis]